jgi:hypothetical protein
MEASIAEKAESEKTEGRLGRTSHKELLYNKMHSILL